MIKLWITSAAILSINCSGGGYGKSSDTQKPAQPTATATDANAVYGPLEHGSDYKSWTKLNKEAFRSPTHGKRFVNVYVNDIGLEAFKSEDMPFPEGSIVVKDSWEAKDGQPSDVAGPIFVMHKRAKGYDAENEDWWFALHWENVPANWQKRVGGKQVYWRSPSKKVNYCGGCHQNYDRAIGGVRAEDRAY